MTPCLSEESLQAYLDGEMKNDCRGGVSAHLNECAYCAGQAREVERSLAALAAAIDDELPVNIPTARLCARIESAAAARATPKQTLASLLWSPWKFAVIAAMVLLVISAIAGFFQSESSFKRQSKEQAVLPTPIDAPASQEPTPKLIGPPVDRDLAAAQQPKAPGHRSHLRAADDSREEAEVVTQFFLLREGEDLTALENLQLVRVELPGSALSEIGLQIDPEAASAPVKADVVLGQDGLARAIRFVR